MQTASSSCSILHPFLPSKYGVTCSPHKSQPLFVAITPLKAASASVSFEPLSINYNSPFSVFPAEACEIVGGEACSANMYPEVKPSRKSEDKQGSSSTRMSVEQVERDYFDYSNESKSVLMGEACDDLGGEFCEAPYNTGVGVYH